MKKLNCSANAKVHTSMHNTMIMFSMPCAKPSGIGTPATKPSHPPFKTLVTVLKHPLSQGEKKKEKKTGYKNIPKNRETEKKKQKKTRPLYTQI